MASDLKPTDVQYIATIRNAKEVILLGSAAPTLWDNLPTPTGLIPNLASGRVPVMISATSARWMGLNFRDLTISIACSLREATETHDGYFLAQAFNSSALLVAMERRFFQTPYDKANMVVAVAPEAVISLRVNGIFLIEAGSHARQATSNAFQDVWEGPIFLPTLGSKIEPKVHLFYAFLGGLTNSYGFDLEMDFLHLGRTGDYNIFHLLQDSDFVASEWRLRFNATHSRSRTLKR